MFFGFPLKQFEPFFVDVNILLELLKVTKLLNIVFILHLIDTFNGQNLLLYKILDELCYLLDTISLGYSLDNQSILPGLLFSLDLSSIELFLTLHIVPGFVAA